MHLRHRFLPTKYRCIPNRPVAYICLYGHASDQEAEQSFHYDESFRLPPHSGNTTLACGRKKGSIFSKHVYCSVTKPALDCLYMYV